VEGEALVEGGGRVVHHLDAGSLRTQAPEPISEDDLQTYRQGNAHTDTQMRRKRRCSDGRAEKGKEEVEEEEEEEEAIIHRCLFSITPPPIVRAATRTGTSSPSRSQS